MFRKLHDGNFKNLFLDFPEESLDWLLPQAPEAWGPVENVEFVRQKPKKRNLSDRGLVLDLPIGAGLLQYRQNPYRKDENNSKDGIEQ